MIETPADEGEQNIIQQGKDVIDVTANKETSSEEQAEEIKTEVKEEKPEEKDKTKKDKKGE